VTGQSLFVSILGQSCSIRKNSLDFLAAAAKKETQLKLGELSWKGKGKEKEPSSEQGQFFPLVHSFSFFSNSRNFRFLRKSGKTDGNVVLEDSEDERMAPPVASSSSTLVTDQGGRTKRKSSARASPDKVRDSATSENVPSSPRKTGFSPKKKKYKVSFATTYGSSELDPLRYLGAETDLSIPIPSLISLSSRYFYDDWFLNRSISRSDSLQRFRDTLDLFLLLLDS